MIVLAKLVACEEDTLGYINYVFEILEEEEKKRLDTKYILTTRFPNWDHRKIDIDEIGYLDFFEIEAGINRWFDGEKMVPYNYNGIQFLKFVPKPKDHEYRMLINL